MNIIYIKNFRKGFATNSSSTHSVIYKNKGDIFKDLNIFELDYYDRCDNTIAATREAKIKYICTQIFGHKFLLEVMCKYYPEMNQYLPLINKQLEEYKKEYNDPSRSERLFGSYTRDNLILYGNKNLEFNIETLKNIIDNDEIVIVGGSDEQEFVYDTCENHKELPELYNVDNKYSVIKNGNYWVGVNESSGDRIRFNMTPDNCIPQYTELVDLKITNKCDHGCPFCYMGSDMKGQHASLDTLKSIVSQLSSSYYSEYNTRVEFAIGGGNVLLYPDLEELFKYIKEKGHIINTTLNIKDIETICTNEKFKNIFNNYVSAVGISISDENDLDILEKYNILKIFNYNVKAIIHLIPEMLGVNKTISIINKACDMNYYKFLFLGYKTNNRGANVKYTKLTNKELKAIFKKSYCIGVDTTFANTYYDYISKNFEDKLTLTRHEGEYSMYIDGVNGNAYKSSYQLDKPYNLKPDGYSNRNKTWFGVIEAFNNIRKDNGFEIYEE